MTVAEQQRREQVEYGRLLPDIVEGIRCDEERVSLSARLSRESAEVDQQLLYRWIQLTEEKLDARRRRAVGLVAVVMWFGVIAVVVPVVGVLLGRISFVSREVTATVGLGAGVALFAALRLRGVTRRAYTRWMERELE